MEILYSPAKVNLGLWVLEKRTDGYHNIFTVFHTVDFYDRIFIKKAPLLKVQTSNPTVPSGKENLVYKALEKFQEWTGLELNYEIFIEKNIPVGAGLGGGSSNAAITLKKINELENYPLSEEELFELASNIGADVPFFLKGGMAIAEGKGNILNFLERTLNKEIFIIYPNITINTGYIYKKVSTDILTNKSNIPIIKDLESGFNNEDWVFNIENKLGDIALELYPEIKEVINTLEFLGLRGYISGSGSSVFVFGEPNKEIETASKLKGWKLIKTRLK